MGTEELQKPAGEHERLTTPFGFHTPAGEVIAGVDLAGQRAVVTGGASGIGAETAKVLAGAGAEVTLAVRNVDAGRRVAGDIAKEHPGARISVAHLDLADRASVAGFTGAWQGPLHILVNNAGIMALPTLRRSAEGWELQFATNYLGHFNLTLGLHRALASAEGARIVSVSSNAHRTSPIVFDDLHFERRPYEAWSAYGQSKTGNVLLAVEAGTRWAGDGITANALMPGGIRTNLQRHQMENLTPEVEEIFDNYPWKTVQEGAATSVLLAASPLLHGVTGRYFEDCNEAELTTDPDSEVGVRPHALDPHDAARLWDVATRLLGS
ncbi:SDR family NAD(P)-dependent oxidoreductase [Amycolatopsis rhabdoformis]|uniref:SDR family NAD(P)-dependent oxidoreductase n=1 Tax=Amycolatopsis rhabdoformis TaxID=1448059 RepID=A0ABZ1IDG9_9PSEU|nr:SDR family NAD(P)-dependent oxidoreductase [Amycolatopsis rhabdoformis]WSE32121.1 SDR family NAD(P)-dependent oxidoreductase [Amycolatopsis rhabdoformis]